MPELSNLTQAGLPQIQYNPVVPNLGPVPTLPVDTTAASGVLGNAAVLNAVSKTIAELPDTFNKSYQVGRGTYMQRKADYMTNQTDAAKLQGLQLQRDILGGNLSEDQKKNYAGVTIGPEGGITTKIQTPYELELDKQRIESEKAATRLKNATTELYTGTGVNSELLAPLEPVGGAAATSGGGGVDDDLVSYVKGKEGWNPNRYHDGAQDSIGWGNKAKPGQMTITPAEAEVQLRQELSQSASRVDAALAQTKMAVTPAQRNTLISFDYNTGGGPNVITKSGGDLKALTDNMGTYVHVTDQATGRKVQSQGLINRRLDEIKRIYSDAETGNKAAALAVPTIAPPPAAVAARAPILARAFPTDPNQPIAFPATQGAAASPALTGILADNQQPFSIDTNLGNTPPPILATPRIETPDMPAIPVIPPGAATPAAAVAAAAPTPTTPTPTATPDATEDPEDIAAKNLLAQSGGVVLPNPLPGGGTITRFRNVDANGKEHGYDIESYDSGKVVQKMHGTFKGKPLPDRIIRKETQVPSKLALDAVDMNVPIAGKNVDQIAAAVDKKEFTSKMIRPSRLPIAKEVANQIVKNPGLKDFPKIQSAKDTLDRGFADPAGGGYSDMAMIEGFQRLVNPGSVVRSQVIDSMQKAAGYMQKFDPKFRWDEAIHGDKMSQAARDRLKTLADAEYKQAYSRVSEHIEGLEGYARQLGITNPREFVQQIMPTAPKLANQATAADADSTKPSAVIPTVRMRRPDGSIMVIPKDKVRDAQQRGATLVSGGAIEG